MPACLRARARARVRGGSNSVRPALEEAEWGLRDVICAGLHPAHEFQDYRVSAQWTSQGSVQCVSSKGTGCPHNGPARAPSTARVGTTLEDSKRGFRSPGLEVSKETSWNGLHEVCLQLTVWNQSEALRSLRCSVKARSCEEIHQDTPMLKQIRQL